MEYLAICCGLRSKKDRMHQKECQQELGACCATVMRGVKVTADEVPIQFDDGIECPPANNDEDNNNFKKLFLGDS